MTHGAGFRQPDADKACLTATIRPMHEPPRRIC